MAMNTHMLRLGAAAAVAVLLAACQGHPSHSPGAAATGGQAIGTAALATAPMLRNDAFDGLYEITVADGGAALLVASINGFDARNAGFVQRLDARSLQPLQTIQVPRKSYALGLNRTTRTLYVGNTLDGSISVVDVQSGMAKGVIQLAEAETNDKGETTYAHTRKVVVDEAHNRVFITSPGRPGLVWIVDGRTNQLTHTIETGEPWTAGAVYDASHNRLYVSGGGLHEILAIDPDAGTIVQRFGTGDTTDREDSQHFFINLALDAQGQRLFAVDANSSSVYVIDLQAGRVAQQVPVGGIGALDIVYNPQRGEFVTTHRGVSRQQPDGTGAVTVFDAQTLAAKRVIDLPAHPNSLALSPDGRTLYVTVKAAHGDTHPAFRADARESVVRIDLP